MVDVRADFGGSMPSYYDAIMARGQFDAFAEDGALLEKRGADLEAIIAKCAAALARLGGAEPFNCPARALAIEARAA
jgi:hypothetical protein